MDLVSQMVYVQDIAGKLGLKISVVKSVLHATTSDARKHMASCLRRAGLPSTVAGSRKSVGVEFQSRAAEVTCLRDARVDNKPTPKVKKLGVMPWAYTKKASILLRGMNPAMFYGLRVS